MNISTITALSLLASVSIGLLPGSARADEAAAAAAAAPRGVAPLTGLAIALPEDPPVTAEYAWSLKVQVPKVVWEVTGKRRPKAEWTEIKADVDMRTMSVTMGYSAATQLAERSQNRLVDLEGRRLSREEALKRLGQNTPILVSVSGEMPDPFYLQCVKPDTLILVIGLGYPEDYSLLPTARASTRKAE